MTSLHRVLSIMIVLILLTTATTASAQDDVAIGGRLEVFSAGEILPGGVLIGPETTQFPGKLRNTYDYGWIQNFQGADMPIGGGPLIPGHIPMIVTFNHNFMDTSDGIWVTFDLYIQGFGGEELWVAMWGVDTSTATWVDSGRFTIQEIIKPTSTYSYWAPFRIFISDYTLPYGNYDFHPYIQIQSADDLEDLYYQETFNGLLISVTPR